MTDVPTMPSLSIVDLLVKPILTGQVRHLLSLGGGLLAAHGVDTGAVAPIIAGAIIAAVPQLWSPFQKWLAYQRTLHAAAAPASVLAQAAIKAISP